MAKQLSDEEILEYKGKEATAVQERYADWLIEKLEIEFSGNAKEVAAKEAAFREAVRLATALRSIFQASPENQAARAEAREEEAPASAKPAKATKAAKATPAEEPEEVPAAAPTGKTKGKKAAKAAAATPAVVDEENGGDTAVAPAAKTSKPQKAAARGGRQPAPF